MVDRPTQQSRPLSRVGCSSKQPKIDSSDHDRISTTGQVRDGGDQQNIHTPIMKNGVGTEQGQRKKREIEAPVCLGDLFAENDEEKEEGTFSQLYEVQDLDVGGSVFKIRQFAWHGANANKVWPGTFNLGEYICDHKGVCKGEQISLKHRPLAIYSRVHRLISVVSNHIMYREVVKSPLLGPK